MSARDVFKAYLFPDPDKNNYDPTSGEDITSGILNVDISYGNEIYEGPWQQVDTGQFTIVSRNQALDPKVNPNLNFNSRISFVDTRTGEFFRGFVTDVNVEYQRNDDPIITITGTDLFGILQRTVVDQEMYDNIIAESTGPTWGGVNFEYFCNSSGGSMADFITKYLNTDNLSGYTPWSFYLDYEPGVGGTTTSLQAPVGFLGRNDARYIPEVGESLLEVVNKYAQTNLNYLSARSQFGYDFIDVYPFPKYNGYFWNIQEDPAIQYQNYDFSSDPEDNASYQSITINNGFNRLTNQIEITNETKTLDGTETVSASQSFGPYTPLSVGGSLVGLQDTENDVVSRVNLQTIKSNNLGTLRYARDILQVVGFPTEEIQQITFDNARYQMIEDDFSYSSYNINQFVRIKHQLNETQIIDRFYNIAGIQHNISPNEWTMSFTLKPSIEELVFAYQGYRPRIEMNSLTGDTNFNFTATIVDYPIEEIGFVYWCLNAPDANDGVYYYPSSVLPPVGRYTDTNVKLGLTQTWNFDDDGILAPYDFETNPFGGYGPGNWTVYAYIYLDNGFTVIAEETLTVGTPEVEADFGWTQNLTNNFGQVQFVDTSINHETGEPDTYSWDFGDGETSNERNPIHVYNPSGPTDTEFDVSLTVFAYGEGGIKVPNTKTETITLTQPTMVPDFTSTANAQVITFTNTSTNVGFEEPDAYLWDFGDGTTSTLKNPVHTFPVTDVNVAQSYTVTLTTRNIWEQTESVTKTITTTALNESGTFPVRYIKFSIDPYTRPGVPTSGEQKAINPVMSVLKATTSGTGANLTYLKPLTGFSDAYVPTLGHRTTSGGFVQQANGSEFFLTRDIQTDPAYYGIGPATRSSLGDSTWRTVRWELVVDLGTTTQLIKNINLRFEDLAILLGGVLTLKIEDFYPRINVQFATTITDVTPNPAGVFGPPTRNGNWVDVGYIKLDGGRMDPTKPAGQRTNTTKNIFKMRPLPLNIPYFNYTFNDKIVSFTSIETADSYAWTFGDGTTSTVKDPVKTYASYGTYTVTLAVTNGGVVTRTTTEPVIVQAPVI